MQLAGELSQAGVLLAARDEEAVEVDEPQDLSAVVQAALLAVDDGKAALDGQAAG